MFKFTEFGKKSGSIHKKNIQKAFHQKYLTLNASLCAQKAKKDVSPTKNHISGSCMCNKQIATNSPLWTQAIFLD